MKARGFGLVGNDEPHAFLQWKATDAFFDFYCKCGAHCNFGGYFAYFVRCPHCKTVWQMPWDLFPRQVSEDEVQGSIVDLEPDESR